MTAIDIGRFGLYMYMMTCPISRIDFNQPSLGELDLAAARCGNVCDMVYNL